MVRVLAVNSCPQTFGATWALTSGHWGSSALTSDQRCLFFAVPLLHQPGFVVGAVLAFRLTGTSLLLRWSQPPFLGEGRDQGIECLSSFASWDPMTAPRSYSSGGTAWYVHWPFQVEVGRIEDLVLCLVLMLLESGIAGKEEAVPSGKQLFFHFTDWFVSINQCILISGYSS